MTDAAILKATMTPVDDPASLAGKVAARAQMLAVANTGQTTLLALVYKLKGANVRSGGEAVRC